MWSSLMPDWCRRRIRAIAIDSISITIISISGAPGLGGGQLVVEDLPLRRGVDLTTVSFHNLKSQN